MISQEYSHQVSRARMPNWVAMYAMPPQSTHVVRRSAFLLSSSLTCTHQDSHAFQGDQLQTDKNIYMQSDSKEATRAKVMHVNGS